MFLQEWFKIILGQTLCENQDVRSYGGKQNIYYSAENEYGILSKKHKCWVFVQKAKYVSLGLKQSYENLVRISK